MTDQQEQRTSKFKDVLNALVEMQHSPAYAVRREVLSRAELLIADLERSNIALSSALADAERGAYENAAKVCEVEALIDDERGYYGKEMAKAIRAKATE